MRTHRRNRCKHRKHRQHTYRRKGGMMRRLNTAQFNERFMRQKYNLTPLQQATLDLAEKTRLAEPVASPEYPPMPTSLLESTLEEEKHIHISEAAMIDKNPWINAQTRFATFDWIYQLCDMRNTQVNNHLGTTPPDNEPLFITYFLATQIVDQYISAKSIRPGDYHTVAAAAIVLASKYEVVHSLRINDIYNLIGRTIPKPALIAMETDIISTLEYPYAPTIYTFFQLKQSEVKRQQRPYLLQLLMCASVIQQFIGMPPSNLVDLCINYINHSKTQIQLPYLPLMRSLKGKNDMEKYANLIHIYAAIMSTA